MVKTFRNNYGAPIQIPSLSTQISLETKNRKKSTDRLKFSKEAFEIYTSEENFGRNKAFGKNFLKFVAT